jgi:hypothetical protein
MNKCFHLILLVMLATSFAASSIAQTTWYVSPTGSDQNAGTFERPFKTVEKALDALKARSGSAAIYRIVLRNGLYHIEKPVVLDASLKLDSASSLFIEAYKGERPVISGNKKVAKNWQKAGVNLWKVKVPDAFTQLFINGKRAIRARYPNEGKWLEPDSVLLKENRLVFTGKIPKEFDEIKTAELHVTGIWHWIRQTIGAFDVEKQSVVTNQYPGPECSSTKIGTRDRAYFENSLRFVDSENEWYLDQEAGELFLFSKTNPALATVEYPTAKQLIEVTGTREERIGNVFIDGITFTGTLWELGPVERKGIQGGIWGTEKGKPVYAPEAAVMLEWTRNSRISNCRFVGLGEGAITLGLGCFQNQIINNQFEDVGSNVIQIGYRASYVGEGHPLHKDFTDPQEVSHHNLIRNNHLKNIATTDKGSVGIWVGYSNHNQIDHNLIEDFPYSGMNVGWYWSDEENMVSTNCHHNTIEWNEVRNGMKYLSDGSGIYLVGSQPGTKVNDNWVYEIGGGYIQANGIYIDEGGANMELARNYIHDLRNTDKATSAIHLHRNNIPSMQIHNNGGDTHFKIESNPGYTRSKRIYVSPSKPSNPALYGLQPKKVISKPSKSTK